jgi:hypothetical protein
MVISAHPAFLARVNRQPISGVGINGSATAA